MLRLIVVQIFVSICAAMLCTQVARAQEEKLLDFVMNAEEVGQAYEVCWLQHAYVRFPMQEPIANAVYVHQGASGKSKRYDIIAMDLNEWLEPTNRRGCWRELHLEKEIILPEKVLGISPVPLELLLKVDPVAMLLQTLDQQSNGNGATFSSLQSLFTKLKFVESRMEKKRQVVVWISESRGSVVELVYSSETAAMPSNVKYFVNLKGLVPKGVELNGIYKKELTEFAANEIDWMKINELYVPTRVSMKRGTGMTVEHEYVFDKWKLGKDVDSTIFNRETMVAKPPLVEDYFVRLRKRLDDYALPLLLRAR